MTNIHPKCLFLNQQYFSDMKLEIQLIVNMKLHVIDTMGYVPAGSKFTTKYVATVC